MYFLVWGRNGGESLPFSFFFRSCAGCERMRVHGACARLRFSVGGERSVVRFFFSFGRISLFFWTLRWFLKIAEWLCCLGPARLWDETSNIRYIYIIDLGDFFPEKSRNLNIEIVGWFGRCEEINDDKWSFWWRSGRNLKIIERKIAKFHNKNKKRSSIV